MVDKRKSNVSGPKTRKTLESVRRPSHDDGETLIESSTIGSVKKRHDNSSHSMEVSGCNSTLPNTDGDDLIDSDDSISEDCTDDDNEPLVREATPLSYQPQALSVPVNRSKKTPSKQIATPKTPLQLPTERSADNEIPERSADNQKFPIVAIVIALVLVGIGYAVQHSKFKLPFLTKSPPEPVMREACEKFYSLEANYAHVDDMLWDMLTVTISRANSHKKRREPGTFLFLHDGSSKMVDRFIENISNITACCFGGTEPIVLERKYFHRADIQRDFGELLAQQKVALQKQGIMIVRNLEGVPPIAAQAFHSICDPEEPLVDRAVIYFTMDTSKVGGQVARSSGWSATKEAEMLLKHMWKDALKPEVLDPLVTRLTESVYRIA